MFKVFSISIKLYVLVLFAVSLDASDTNNSTFTPSYSFLNTSVNYLDWDKPTENTTAQNDFAYLELEGGAGWSWGEFYGFVDIENPLKSYKDNFPNELRFAVKPIFDIKLHENFSLHIQDYYFKSDTFYVNNLVTGFSYKYTSDFGLWIKPFIGLHYQNSTYYNGSNGYMAGWAFNYDVKLLGENFSLSQWHEMEFNRNEEDYQLLDGTPIGNEKSHGINGAISIWWHINSMFTTGVQYRYADNKLGFESSQSAFIYSFKYNL